jgi:RimJ/RimL family protein N-acetyltransferase
MIGVNGMSKKIIETAMRRGEKCWVILQKKEIAAYVWISSAREKVMSDTRYFLENQQDFSYWWRDVYVSPQYRGKRLLRELFSLWLSSLENSEIKDIYTEIDPINLRSIKAHAALGFKKVGTLYMLCILGARFYYVKNSNFSKISFRFYPRNVYYSILSE